jgi:hypothetical protein
MDVPPSCWLEPPREARLTERPQRLAGRADARRLAVAGRYVIIPAKQAALARPLTDGPMLILVDNAGVHRDAARPV